jgi:DNA-binding HxlR family transcriptional regulator
VSTRELIRLFHHRWAAPALVLLAERDGARFVELQLQLGVGHDSLRRAIDTLIQLEFAERTRGYGHPLRPEYRVTSTGRAASAAIAAAVAAPSAPVLLRKWSMPVLAQLDRERRFSELSARLPGVTPRALAQALATLEQARLIQRQVQPTRPPSTVYRRTRLAEAVTTGP